LLVCGIPGSFVTLLMNVSVLLEHIRFIFRS
jgi:hypothetical protein